MILARRGIGRLLAASTLCACALGSAAAPSPSAAGRVADAGSVFAGWAMDAYPGDGVATLAAAMRKQVAAGSNIVWLGHNNPGEVDQHKGEPGLSYAVWQALQNASSPQHVDAQVIVAAVGNALRAARSVGVKVVLPVGYQIQMGKAWNTSHPQDLRVDGGGRTYWNGGNAASFYSPDYQHDILAYYRWVDASYVRPFSDTIHMVNIADEPSDGDYTVWADHAFRARYGYGMNEVGTNPGRLRALGRFQAEYIADYAAWSAQQWLTIDPATKVTLSFDGGFSRYKHEGPDLEAIFKKAPSNFVVTFDMYPRDGLYNTPLRPGDLTALFALTRTLGHYSALYNKPLWLWSAANSWGLNGASSDPGTIADAVANGIYVAQLVREGGGMLEGVAVWNYNIRGQGLFNDTHPYTYDPEQMFSRVSASFPLLRGIMTAPPGQPDSLILASNAHDLQVGGQIRAMRALDTYDWTALVAFARDDIAAPVVTHLSGEDLAAIHSVVVLARTPADLAPTDRTALIALLSHGGTILAAAPVARLLYGQAPATLAAMGGSPQTTVTSFKTANGSVYSVSGMTVESLFTDANQRWVGPATRGILHRRSQTSGYILSAGGITLLYSGLAAPGASIVVGMPLSSGQTTLTVYAANGTVRQTISLAGRTGALRVFVPRRGYALAAVGAT